MSLRRGEFGKSGKQFSYPCLERIQRYAKRKKRQDPTVLIARAGIQNRRILTGLLASRLAAKNIAKNAPARIQNKGLEEAFQNCTGNYSKASLPLTADFSHARD